MKKVARQQALKELLEDLVSIKDLLDGDIDDLKYYLTENVTEFTVSELAQTTKRAVAMREQLNGLRKEAESIITDY